MKRLEPGFPATFRVARFEDFDSRSQYHAIVFNESLSYVRDPLALLNSFVRLMRPDGIFIVSLCYDWWQAPMLDRCTSAPTLASIAERHPPSEPSRNRRSCARKAGCCRREHATP